jgi:cytochrome P450
MSMAPPSNGTSQRIPPRPSESLVWGSLNHIKQNRIDFPLRLMRAYGGVVRFRILTSPWYLITHPDGVQRILSDNHRNYGREPLRTKAVAIALGNGLFVSDGAFWLRQRRLMQPIFHRRQIAAFGAMMVQNTLALLAHWQAAVEQGRPLDIALEMTRLTLDNASNALFSMNVHEQFQALAAAFALLNEEVFFRFSHPFYPPPWVPTRHNQQLRAALHTIDQIVQTMISERRHQRGQASDLLAMLMQARDVDTGETMSDQQVRDEVVSLIFAGHETAATALAWTFALLVQHPDVAERVWAEIAAELGQRLPTVDDLPKLPYSRMVLDEVLRLYPPSPLATVQARAADEVCGYQIEANAGILLSSHATHRNADFWEQPEVFDPERFRSERVAQRHRYAYFPFYGGPHLCIGKEFALVEMQLVLVTIAQRYRLHLLAGQEIEPQTQSVTLRPRGGLPMIVEPR